MYQIKVKDSEINEVLDQCIEVEQSGNSKFPGMTYEQGVQEAIRWIIGEESNNPLTD